MVNRIESRNGLHTLEIVNQVLDLGILDVVMFSINPAYDYRHGDYAYGGVDERETLYRRFQAEQVGITVMKPFGGGQLLDGALINQYYDLAKIGDTLAADHYRKLEAHAGDCVQCGHCDRRRPFHVAQSDRMKEIAAYFGA